MRKFIEKVLKITGKTLRILHLLRVQLFVALFLLLAIPVGVSYRLGTFDGLSDAITHFSLALITISLFLLSWTLHITTRLVLIYGPARYGIPNITLPPAKRTAWRRFLHSPWFTLTIAAALPIPTLIAIWCNTECISALGKAIAIAIGFIVAVVFLILAATLHDWIEAQRGTTTKQMYPPIFIIHPREGRTPTGRLHVEAAIPAAPSDTAIAGILDEDGQLRSGHRIAILYLLFFFFFYAVFFFQGMWADYNSAKLPAAIFFVFLLLTWITWILAGLSFTLDRFHIPILTTIFGFSLLYSAVFPKDHEFKVSTRETARAPLTPGEAVAAWQKTHPGIAPDSPIVVITAEGGGIEAAAWANVVLSKLEEATHGQLHDSVVLVSSVSGGSTGAYYYLDQFSPDASGHPKTFNAELAFKYSEASSLSAAAWGLAYPDFARTLPLISSFVHAYSDRGYALERSWLYNSGALKNSSNSPDSMGKWIDQTANGLRPAVIFNATGVETGQPVLFGTTSLSEALPFFQDDQKLEQQFLSTFPATDLAVSTAARMSAAFPYVSPEARPAKSLLKDYSKKPPPPSQITYNSPRDAWDAARLHIADGGLFDNTGVVSAAHWIYDLSQDPSVPHRPIVLLMITSPYQQRPGVSWSWQRQLVGPIETLLHVRTGSQHVRRNLEAQLLANLANKTADSSNSQAAAANAAFMAQKSAGPTKPVKTFPPVTVLRFCNATDPDKQTLSWHLTKSQQDALQDTWRDDYGNESAQTHAEVAALVHLLDPTQPDVAPANTCPVLPQSKGK